VSPYGDKIAFYYGTDAHKNLRLNVVNLHATGFKTLLSSGISQQGLSWRLDQRITYQKGTACNGELAHIHQNGGGWVTLFSGTTSYPVPRLSIHHPMDRTTAYAQYKCDGCSGKVCTIGDEGQGQKCVTPVFGACKPGGHGPYAMDWSSDGARIAYVAKQSGGSACGVYWMPVGGAAKLITTTKGCQGGVTFGEDDKVVYFSEPDAGKFSQIHRVGLDGKGKHQLTHNKANHLLPHYYPKAPRTFGTWRASAHNPLYTPQFYTWDARLRDIDVVWDGKEYKLYYAACSDTTGPCKTSIGLTTSPDGSKWTLHNANPVIHHGTKPLVKEGAGGPAVVFDGKTYHMYYLATGASCSSSGVGYAHSTDGKSWTHHSSLVLAPKPGTWEGSYKLDGVTVIRDGGQFKMWYAACGCKTCDCKGTPCQIGYATSADGKAWTRSPKNPVLTKGAAGSFDAVHVTDPEVVSIDGTYHLWYRGQDNAGTGKVGHATSKDGHTWVRDKASPVINPGGSGWNKTIRSPAVVRRGSYLGLWLQGADGSKTSLGHYAIAP